MKKAIYLLCLVWLTATQANAQSAPPASPAPNESLAEKRMDEMVQLRLQALKAETEKADAQLHFELQSLEQGQEKLTWGTALKWLGLTGFSGLLLFAGWVLKFRGWADKKLKENATNYLRKKTPEILIKALTDTAEENKENIRALVQSHEKEKMILDERPFLVICHNPDEKTEAMKVLKDQMKFQKCVPILASEMVEEKLGEYHLVVLWGIKKEFEDLHNRLRDYFLRVKQTGIAIAFLYYTENNRNDLVGSNRELCNAANSPYTLYGQIMQTLKYFDLKMVQGS